MHTRCDDVQSKLEGANSGTKYLLSRAEGLRNQRWVSPTRLDFPLPSLSCSRTSPSSQDLNSAPVDAYRPLPFTIHPCSGRTRVPDESRRPGRPEPVCCHGPRHRHPSRLPGPSRWRRGRNNSRASLHLSQTAILVLMASLIWPRYCLSPHQDSTSCARRRISSRSATKRSSAGARSSSASLRAKPSSKSALSCERLFVDSGIESPSSRERASSPSLVSPPKHRN